MNSISILDLIQRRLQYPLGHDCGDAWIDEILESDREETYLVTTENVSSLYGPRGRNKRRILFETYNIKGIFGLSNPMVDSAVTLMLLVLQKKDTQMILTGSYNKPLFQGSAYCLGLREDSVPLDIYPSDFREYCRKIEGWIASDTTPTDDKNYDFNIINSQDIDLDKVFPQHYRKAVYNVIRFLANEQTVPLSEMASVIRPLSLRGERALVITSRDFAYPLSFANIKEGWKTNTIIQKGDIICKGGITNRLYLVFDQVDEEVYAGANDYIIRPHKTETAAYLFIYLNSDTGKTIINANTTGSVLPRMSIRDWDRLPVIIPKKNLKDYDAYFKLQFYQQKSATEYIKFFSSALNIQEACNAEDVLDMELLAKARLFKNDTIRTFLQEDLKELNACFRAKAFKATLILCGSILEGVLIDWVSEKHGENYFEIDLYVEDRDGKKKRADLIDYINIIKEIQKPAWMEEARKAHTIRQKRNLVHAKLCLKSEEINEAVCREIITYLKDVLSTRGFNLS